MAILREGNPDRICLHHSAVEGVPADVTALKKRLASHEAYHKGKEWAQKIKTPGEYGYKYIEYHRAIAGNGHEVSLQKDKYVLYHAGDNARGKDSFNLHGIAVLVEGNYMKDKPTPEQLEAFARIIARFERKYKVDVIVRGHKQTSLTGTSCPGTNLGDHTKGFLKDAITRANEILKNNLPDTPLQDEIKPEPPQEPETPQEPTECEKQVKRLEEENSTLDEMLRASQASKKEILEGVAELEESYTELEVELKSLEGDYARLLEEKSRFEKQYMDCVEKANAEPSWLEKLVEWVKDKLKLK